MMTHTDAAAPPPQLPPDAPITAGRYLRLRREAAGRSIPDVAKIYELQNFRFDQSAWARAEQDETPLNETTLRKVVTAFPFDRRVYDNLVLDLPPGRICRGCGCTWNDPCSSGCAWTSADQDICTACATPRLVEPVHAAFDDVALFGARDVGALVDALVGIEPDAAVLCHDGSEIIGIVSRKRSFGGVDRKEIVLVCSLPAGEGTA